MRHESKRPTSVRVSQMVFALLAAGATSCSLVVDTSDVDRGCRADEKFCNDGCVSKSDPAYGCDENRCEPCNLSNAIPGCFSGTCVVERCLLGYECVVPNDDAGALSGDVVGCYDLHFDPDHCGSCTRRCGSNELCVSGQCVPD